MALPPRQQLEEGPILDPLFVHHYWRLSRRPSKGAARWVAAKMRKLGVPPSGRVLDVGCGPGWLVRFLAELFPAMRFVGLDASEPMIVRARSGPLRGGDHAPTGRVQFLVGDGQQLPFRDGQFNLVISGATLHHVANPVALFDEIARVLAADGHVIISDLNRSVPGLLWPVVVAADWIERRLRPTPARHLSEGFVSSYKAAYDPEEIRRFLGQSKLGPHVRYYPGWLQHWIQTPPRPSSNK